MKYKPKIKSTVHVNPPKNFNEWAANLHKQINQQYNAKIKSK